MEKEKVLMISKRQSTNQNTKLYTRKFLNCKVRSIPFIVGGKYTILRRQSQILNIECDML